MKNRYKISGARYTRIPILGWKTNRCTLYSYEHCFC